MNGLKILWTGFVIGCIVQELHGQCITAYGGQGQCKSLSSCAPLDALVKKPVRTSEDIDILRRSHCGFIGNSPAVCCPENQPRPPPPPPPPPNNQCTTADNKLGRCVGLYSCPHLADLLKPPVPDSAIQYVTNSRCNGQDQYSVCCGPAPSMNTKCQMSAFPPDSASKCCGRDISFGDKIIGGSEAQIDEYPWLVLIEYTENGQLKTSCGGALISGRYVLTAAHCFENKNKKAVRIRLGEHDITNEGPDCVGRDCNIGAISIPIEKIIIHEDYKPAQDTARKNDIALVRMTRLAPFGDFVRPICLPTVDITQNGVSNYNFTVAGWGAVSTKISKSPTKMYVDLPYVPHTKCQRLYIRNAITLGQAQFCAGGMIGKDSCRGDSGGPLMLEQNRQYDLVGIVSFGPKACGESIVPGIYTNVYKYLNWIRNNISV